MTLQASVGELVQIQFPVFDWDGITPVSGLVDANFSKLLIRDNIVSAVVMTVTEVGATGRYVMSFIPDANGLWYAEVETPIEDIFADQVEVGPPPDDWIDAIVAAVWSEILPGVYPADSAGERLASMDDLLATLYVLAQGIDANVQDVHDALIMAVLTASGGSTTSIETNATKADGFYDDLTVVIRDSDGNVARRIVSYSQTNGTFEVGELPFTPQVGDEVIVLGILGKVLCEGSDTLLDLLIEVWQRLGLDPENPLCITKTTQEADGWRIVSQVIGNKMINTREDV